MRDPYKIMSYEERLKINYNIMSAIYAAVLYLICFVINTSSTTHLYLQTTFDSFNILQFKIQFLWVDPLLMGSSTCLHRGATAAK